MKAQAAWKEMYIFSDERWTAVQHSGDGSGGCPNQPHSSSKSQLLDRGPLTQSFSVPAETADSSFDRPCSTAFQQQVLQAHFECGRYARELRPPHVSLCLRGKMDDLKDSKHNLADKVVFLRRHSWHDDLKPHLTVDVGEDFFIVNCTLNPFSGLTIKRNSIACWWFSKP